MKQTPLYPIQRERITTKVSRGLVWTFGINTAVKIGVFAKSIVIARVLFPDDLGLLGAALVVSGIIEVVSRTGFEEAIVQKPDDPESYLDSVWTFNIARGFLLFIFMVVAAPAAGWIFRDQRVVSVITVVAVTFVFTGAANPAVVLRRREIKMLSWNLYRCAGPAADVVIGTIAVILTRNVWGLVAGIIANGILSTVISFIVAKRSPRLSFNLRKVAELFGFGKHVLGSGVVIYFITQGDNLVVGRVAGIASLGLYKLAYGFANAPVTTVTHVLGDVLFPAYSRLQNDKRAAVRGFEIALETSVGLALFFGVITFLFAPELISAVFGSKWLDAAWALRILCVFMLLRTVGANLGPFAYGLGRPDLVLKGSIAKLIMMAVIIYPSTKYLGIAGAALATTVPSFFHTTWVADRLIKLCGWNRKEFAGCFSSPAVGAAAAAAVGVALKYGSSINFDTPLNLTAGVLLCALTYSVAFLLADNLSKRSLLPTVREMVRSVVTG
jgi:lipopolysaccharide exporter